MCLSTERNRGRKVGLPPSVPASAIAGGLDVSIQSSIHCHHTHTHIHSHCWNTYTHKYIQTKIQLYTLYNTRVQWYIKITNQRKQNCSACVDTLTRLWLRSSRDVVRDNKHYAHTMPSLLCNTSSVSLFRHSLKITRDPLQSWVLNPTTTKKQNHTFPGLYTNKNKINDRKFIGADLT